MCYGEWRIGLGTMERQVGDRHYRASIDMTMDKKTIVEIVMCGRKIHESRYPQTSFSGTIVSRKEKDGYYWNYLNDADKHLTALLDTVIRNHKN